MLIAILCLNGVEQPFKGHQCPFFLPLRRRNLRLRRGSLRPRGGRRTQRPPPWIRACDVLANFYWTLLSSLSTIFALQRRYHCFKTLPFDMWKRDWRGSESESELEPELESESIFPSRSRSRSRSRWNLVDSASMMNTHKNVKTDVISRYILLPIFKFISQPSQMINLWCILRSCQEKHTYIWCIV